MGLRIKPGLGVGSEGIQIGIGVSWGSHDNHRQRQQRRRRAASRAKHGKLSPKERRLGVAAQPKEAPPIEYDYRPPYRAPGKVIQFPNRSRDPNVFKDSDWDRVLRGNDNPAIPKIINRSIWSIYAIIWHWIVYGIDKAEETDERWKIPRRPYSTNPPVLHPRPDQVVPKEWEPPPKTLDEISEYVIREIGKIRVGSVVLGEQGEVIWDPGRLPKAVESPTGVLHPRVETRGLPKGKTVVIEVDPVPSSRPSSRPRKRELPEEAPANEPAEVSSPAQRPVVSTPPLPSMNPFLQGIVLGALSVLPIATLPGLKLGTVSGSGLAPSLTIAVRPVPRPWLREARLRKDVKEKSNLKYLAVAKVVDRIWSKASNLLEYGEAVLDATHRTDGSSVKYTRWDRWSADVSSGRAEVHYDEVVVNVLMNEIEDHVIAFINKKKLESLARAGKSRLDRELRAMKQIYTRMGGEGARF